MDEFAREVFRLGTLRCFRHFSLDLRGREELLLTVWREKRISADIWGEWGVTYGGNGSR